MHESIPFNRPCRAGQEEAYLRQVLEQGKWCGDGPFTKRAQAWLESSLGFRKALLTTSCTDALEMAALLCGVGPGDEVILPSYTFVSTANAFALRGAKLVFVDSLPDHPNLDPDRIEPLVTSKTKAIVVMHYAGVACEMERIQGIAKAHGLMVIEDAAQCIDATYQGRPLGSFGALGTFSFHETKNIACGEGGCLLVNDPDLDARAEIIREKGTNRAAFFRGDVDKYGWVDLGSSFLPSEFNAAVLMSQLEGLASIQARRRALWERYAEGLRPLEAEGRIRLPVVPPMARHNAHVFYLVVDSLELRSRLIHHLRAEGIQAVFHYQSLHRSRYFEALHDGRALPCSDGFTDGLLRLPLFADLRVDEVDRVIDSVRRFFAGDEG